MQSRQSNGIIDMLLNQFGGSLATQLSQRLGVDEQTARSAISIGIPLLLSALARNSSTPQGAQSLSGALERDHDGSILGQLDSLLSNPSMAEGSGILRHTLGQQQPQVEQNLSRATGVDGAALLQMLAPLVMGQLGQVQRQQQLDPDGVGDILRQEQQQVRQSNPGIMDLLSQIMGGGLDAGDTDSTGERPRGVGDPSADTERGFSRGGTDL